MSIELKEARKKLDIIEKCASNPILILTDLFSERVSGSNFLYQVNIDGKYILDYLVDYLKTLPVFEWCSLKCNAYDLKVYAPALKYGKYQNFQSDDLIVKVDMDKKTYKLCSREIKQYEDIINKVYEFSPSELSDYWKKFEDLTLKKRVKNAFAALSTNKKIHIRIYDFFFHFYVPKNRVEEVLNKEKEKVENRNSSKLKFYNEDIDRQKFYMENAPAYIEKVKNKQLEIAKFLEKLGYKENVEMDEY